MTAVIITSSHRLFSSPVPIAFGGLLQIHLCSHYDRWLLVHPPTPVTTTAVRFAHGITVNEYNTIFLNMYAQSLTPNWPQAGSCILQLGTKQAQEMNTVIIAYYALLHSTALGVVLFCFCFWNTFKQNKRSENSTLTHFHKNSLSAW